jgi:hypothetical protein
MPLLQTTTAEGALKGMVTARAPHELGEQEVAYLQDALVNQPGFVARRGAITGTTPITAANLDSSRPVAINTVYDPSGAQKVCIFYFKDTGSQIQLWMSIYTPALVFVQKHYITTMNLYPSKWGWVHTATAIDGSLIVSFRYNYNRDPSIGNEFGVYKYYGACPSTIYAAGAAPTATITFTEGSTSVTGTAGEIAKISFPGLIINTLGIVKSVTSSTQVELLYPATNSGAAVARSFYVIDNMSVFRARGKISCAAGVLVGITGYGTRFTEIRDRATITPGSGYTIVDATTMKKLAGLDVNTPAPAASDTVLGVPTAVTRSASLKNYILSASDSTVDSFYNRHPGQQSVFPLPPPKAAKGSFFAAYKGLMVSFNAVVQAAASDDAGDLQTTARAYLHGPRFPEIMDHSATDGDWFEVSSIRGGDTYGVAVVAGSDSVVLCKAQESFAMTGDTPDDFTLQKIADDGALHFDGVATWRGKAIWCGRTGIWMYSSDMPEPENIIENTILPTWKNLVASFVTGGTAPDTDGQMTNVVHAFVYKDYLFVNVMSTAFGASVYTDGVARTQNPIQLMIYMPTRAVSFLTNFNFQGFVQIGNAGYVILPQDSSTTHHLFPVDNLFVQGGATVDSILTANSYNSGSVPTSVGPWFHMESRAFDVGDGLLKKNWKQLAIESKMTGTKRMFLDTVAGLNSTAVRAALPFTGTGSFLAARVKFRTRDQYMRFRLYEDINNRPSTLIMGAWQWAYKAARRGAV